MFTVTPTLTMSVDRSDVSTTCSHQAVRELRDLHRAQLREFGDIVGVLRYDDAKNEQTMLA